MQAALLVAPRLFALTEVRSPAPAANEVIVRVKHAGICGSDLHFYVNARIGDAALSEPFIMGHEFSGVIEDTNGIASSPPVGTRVAVEPAVHCGQCPFCRAGRPNICPNVRFTGFPPYSGAFAEYVAIPVHNVYPLPDSITDETGPVLETLAVAVHALELVPDVRGKTCAVLGAGPVGLLVAQLLIKNGAKVVLATDPIPARRRKALELGCAAAFDPKEIEDIQSFLEHTTDYGPELIFEAAGEPQSFQQAYDLTAPGGMVAFIGIYPLGSFSIDFGHARRKELQTLFVRRSLPANYPEAIRLVAEEHVDIGQFVTHILPLSRIEDAFDLAVNRRDGSIKIVLAI
ncbi:MAG: hypothetical protein C4527_10550 [Candidatus Omnitrophota bacterium]|jgi:L-iditol 2-dehydrogenase|nr:MAG: hypothetical protein C4527_10550 [Candidatus Omnitrophota bacterium]